MAVDLIPEYERVVGEAEPAWFAMENVPAAPVPVVAGYAIHSFPLDNRWLGEEQHRVRRWSFGLRGDKHQDLRRWLEVPLFENSAWACTVLASGSVKPGTEGMRGKRPGRHYGYTTTAGLSVALRLQGLPSDFLADAPFTMEGKHKVVGNGVPLPMGRAIARAVRHAMQREETAV